MDEKKITVEEFGKASFLKNEASHFILALNLLMALVYFSIITFWFPRGNTYLFALLIAGEVYHLWQVLTFIYTVWGTEYQKRSNPDFIAPVDVFITVAGEPAELVEKTARAAKAMRYPDFKVHILNDGYVAKKENWKEIEDVAKRVGVNCITRKVPGGAKAGNINYGMGQTKSPFIVIFDADHVPHGDFLEKMMRHFSDEGVAFVQSPQYYANHAENYITGAAWDQEKLFFGPICKGKKRLNSSTMCGTNMAIRRTALEEVGGMCDTNIAEDFVTGLFIHEKGWKSVYVPEILAEGLAPEDFLSYYKQQHRWARGSLEVIFNYNPIFQKGLTWGQKIQYLSSASYYLSGAVVLMNAVLPILFLFFGISPLQISTMTLAGVFLPYIFITVYVLQLTSNFTYTFRALAFSMGAFALHIRAIWDVLVGTKTSFAVTSKKHQETGNYIHLVIPHLIYLGLMLVGIPVAFYREGLSPSLITNITWAVFNASVFLPFILAATPLSSALPAPEQKTGSNSKEAVVNPTSPSTVSGRMNA